MEMDPDWLNNISERFILGVCAGIVCFHRSTIKALSLPPTDHYSLLDKYRFGDISYPHIFYTVFFFSFYTTTLQLLNYYSLFIFIYKYWMEKRRIIFLFFI